MGYPFYISQCLAILLMNLDIAIREWKLKKIVLINLMIINRNI